MFPCPSRLAGPAHDTPPVFPAPGRDSAEQWNPKGLGSAPPFGLSGWHEPHPQSFYFCAAQVPPQSCCRSFWKPQATAALALAAAAAATAVAVTGWVDHCEREVGQDTPLSEARIPERGGERWEEGDASARPAEVRGQDARRFLEESLDCRPESAPGNTADSWSEHD